MIVAVVVGNLWATRKDERLEGLKLLIVQPVDYARERESRPPIIAADIIGAGVGERVLVVTGSSARSAAGNLQLPVDATVVGIVDDQDIDETCIRR